ncbi:hypothetical protein Ancab_000664 [Ancistrocladus abbreviatus]
MEDLQPPNNQPRPTTTNTNTNTNTAPLHLQAAAATVDNAAAAADDSTPLSPPSEDYYIDSNCSTPYVSAPSSPGRAAGGGGGFYYSAPASPMHFVLLSSRSSAFATNSVPSPSDASSTGTSGSFEFEFSARFANNSNGSASPEIGSMSSADELFLNGQIRPMKLSTHLQRPQVLAPLLDVADDTDGTGREQAEEEEDGDEVFQRRREMRLRDKSLRRRTRSLSPLRNMPSFDWGELVAKEDEIDGSSEKTLLKKPTKDDDESESKVAGGAETTTSNETTPSVSASSSRCSSAGRSSKRWVFLKDFLRSKSEGSSNGKFWSNISFSPAKEKKASSSTMATSSTPSSSSFSSSRDSKEKVNVSPSMEGSKGKKNGKDVGKKSPATKPTNGVGKRRVPPSAHELHYTANRAQAEEMRKKTFLPYRQGLLGCLGFSSKGYGAMNGFARALNPVS